MGIQPPLPLKREQCQAFGSGRKVFSWLYDLESGMVCGCTAQDVVNFRGPGCCAFESFEIYCDDSED